MKKANHYYLIAMLLLGVLVFGFAYPDGQGEGSTAAPAAEAPMPAAAAFDQMMAVLTHKRCVNCHPAGDRPHQGEDSHLHHFGVQRGETGHGLAALQCSTCHQETNNNISGVPGAPHWHLAPRSMAWEGLSRTEIAASMLDPARNGGRSLEEIVHHLTEDALVLWAFEPGVDDEGNPREKPPVSKADYIQAVKDWAAAGAQIPNE
ncbi:hypothetical protein [Flavilitoribacter nigricans]|uniref:Isoquinoline 1-oxidoreductase subunit n=1 Tax=Flavilitoribacter nigricans (strain ATCC 23147 / DSM 23189 / NBRC 102662 / NCIMB 1420 / SS-2) TaxID=1122177 RepID=A0A2D0NIZ6_FLAN2|nr:hypothetical protein [Flavilitoribacter nigricans]PHN08169.1 hypothetical protein CRP01_02280 [Flavilitoribacter nigricans DSM 23189 = NBRC 102662]